MRFPTNAVALGPRALETKARLRVRFAAGTDTIFENAFQSSALREVVIPASVREIGSRAFECCVTLTRVTFEPGSALEKVGDFAFFRTSLREFHAPPALRELGYCCFAGTSGLTTVSFGENLQKVGQLCFWYTGVN